MILRGQEFSFPRLLLGRGQVAAQVADSSRLGARVPLKLVVRLLPHVVGEHRVAPRVVLSLHHDPLVGTQTTMDPQMFVLAFDQCDHITTQEHLHLGVAILKELVLQDLRLVPEKVHL